jgi:hypothetical protein
MLLPVAGKVFCTAVTVYSAYHRTAVHKNTKTGYNQGFSSTSWKVVFHHHHDNVYNMADKSSIMIHEEYKNGLQSGLLKHFMESIVYNMADKSSDSTLGI